MTVNFGTSNTEQSNETKSAACDSTATVYYVNIQGTALGASMPVVLALSIST
jgi:hypothetical protein